MKWDFTDEPRAETPTGYRPVLLLAALAATLSRRGIRRSTILGNAKRFVRGAVGLVGRIFKMRF